MNLPLSRVSLPLRALIPAEAICEMASRWQKRLIPPKMRGGLDPCTCIKNHSKFFHGWFPTAWEAGYERDALPRKF